MMKSTSSCSKTIIAEDVRRYWIIAAAAFAAWFLAAVVPVILNYRSFDMISAYAVSCLRNSSVLMLFTECLYAVALSAGLFRYLHRENSVVAVHARPITRTRLFLLHTVSGILLMLIPVLVTALLFMMLRGASIDTGLSSFAVSSTAPAVYSGVHILQWILETMIILVFVFTMSSLAAMIAGTRTIHVLLALFINGFPVGMVLMIQSACKAFLVGFADNISNGFIIRLHPVTYLFTRQHFLSGGEVTFTLIYAAVSILAVLAGIFLYRNVRLENTGRACFYPVAGDILCILITLPCSVALGLVIAGIGSSWSVTLSAPIFMTAFLGCSVLLFLVCRMIAESSVRILNRRTLKGFCVYLLAAALFCSFTIADLSGFQNRVTAPSAVASVEFSCGLNNTVLPLGSEHDAVSNSQGFTFVTLKDPEVISHITALQKEAVRQGSGGKTPSAESSARDVSTEHVEMIYRLKNGRSIHRSYDVAIVSGDSTYQTLRDIFCSREYQSAALPLAEDYLANNPHITCGSLSGDAEEAIDAKDQKKLLAAYTRDRSSRSFAYTWALSTGEKDESVYTLDFVFDDSSLIGFSLPFTREDSRTWAFLNSRGYIR